MLTNLKIFIKVIVENISIFFMQDRKLILLSLFEKWNPIALGCHWDNGTRDCPLCKKYYRINCKGCPVQKRTTLVRCMNTPYVRFVTSKISSLEYTTYIENEIEFLISLLDEETQKNLERIFIKWCKEGRL